MHGMDQIMHELNITYYGSIYPFGVEIWITQTLKNLWICMAIVIAFAVIVRLNMKKWTDNPKGLQNVAEIMIETFESYVRSITGKEYAWLGNYFFGITMIIAAMNVSGMMLMRPPTADLAVTSGMALVTFLLIHILGIAIGRKHYVHEFMHPTPLMLPLHIISELAVPLSLMFRLFGVILGGFIIITLAYSLMPIFLKIGFPMIMHFFFDVFVALLQVFIFLTLSLTFIRGKLPE